ncbi:MAG: hypothetical protein Q4B82_00915 [Alysiella sp.]|nr:hypothetical protein [Alysiella sp.]MDO4433129.1 hypothetical protein [Alysiella sp.]
MKNNIDLLAVPDANQESAFLFLIPANRKNNVLMKNLFLAIFKQKTEIK